MTEKELFNAINDIDEKYITAAWNDTDPTSDTVIVHESAGTSGIGIIGLAAACAGVLGAAALAVCIRVGQLPRDITPPANVSDGSGSSGISSTVSPGTESFTLTVPAEDPLPITLYGPDHVQITYGDVLGVTLPDGKVVKADEFDASNWESIVCDGFTYLASPTGSSVNSVDAPELFEANSASESVFFDNSDYKRFNVGDKYGGLTLKSAMTIFRNDGSSPEERLSECIAEFEGSITLDAYILRRVPENPRGMICVPKASGCALPVMFPTIGEDGKFTSKAFIGDYFSGTFEYKSEYPIIRLQNINEFDLGDLYDNGSNYAEVTITLSNIHMETYNAESSNAWRIHDFILADIDEIRPRTVVTQPDDALPFEIYGPDYTQLSYGDADDIVDANMDPISRGDLTADNWDQIWCEGFCYLSAAAGANYNSVDDAECFDEFGKFTNAYFGDSPRYDYRRYNAGESINGLKVDRAMTVFTRTAEHSLGESGGEELKNGEKLYMSNVSFSGEAALTAYLVAEKNIIFCIPVRGETGLPVMFTTTDSRGNYTYGCREQSIGTADGDFFCRTELPAVIVTNSNGLDIAKYLGNKGYVKVRLTLDNIFMFCSRENTRIEANIKSISSIDGTMSDSAGNAPVNNDIGVNAGLDIGAR